jgi:hypothetical protein
VLDRAPAFNTSTLIALLDLGVSPDNLEPSARSTHCYPPRGTLMAHGRDVGSVLSPKIWLFGSCVASPAARLYQDRGAIFYKPIKGHSGIRLSPKLVQPACAHGKPAGWSVVVRGLPANAAWFCSARTIAAGIAGMRPRVAVQQVILRQGPSQVCDTNIQGDLATALSRSHTSNDDRAKQKQRDHT